MVLVIAKSKWYWNEVQNPLKDFRIFLGVFLEKKFWAWLIIWVSVFSPHHSQQMRDKKWQNMQLPDCLKRKMMNALICCGIKWWSKHEVTAELVMPRKKKVPSRYYSNGNEYFHSNPKLFYRQHYFDVVQRATSATINERICQPVTYDFLQWATSATRNERLFRTSNFCNK